MSRGRRGFVVGDAKTMPESILCLRDFEGGGQVRNPDRIHVGKTDWERGVRRIAFRGKLKKSRTSRLRFRPGGAAAASARRLFHKIGNTLFSRELRVISDAVRIDARNGDRFPQQFPCIHSILRFRVPDVKVKI